MFRSMRMCVIFCATILAVSPQMSRAEDDVWSFDWRNVRSYTVTRVLNSAVVHEELNLSPEQKAKLIAVVQEMDGALREQRDTRARSGRTPAPRGSEIAAEQDQLIADRKPAVSAILTAAQIQRIDGILLQSAGVAALTTREIVDKLELTPDQTSKLATIKENAAAQSKELGGQGFDFGRSMEIGRERDKAMLAVLTPGQTQRFDALNGKRVDWQSIYGGEWSRPASGRPGAQANRANLPPSDWKPPQDADPAKISREAASDLAGLRFNDALAKYIWLHRHGLEDPGADRKSSRNLRINTWKRLADNYPPAWEALKAERDTARASVERNENMPTALNDFFAINNAIRDDAPTRDLFLTLEKSTPALAVESYPDVQATLIRLKDYRVCAKYLDPKKGLAIIEQDRTSARFTTDASSFFARGTRAKSAMDVATLIALLVLNDRKPEAVELAQQAKGQWSEPAIVSMLDEALTGQLPTRMPQDR